MRTFFILFIILLCSCKSEVQNQETASNLTEVAREAYIFAYPMLMGYQAQYYNAVNTESPIYRGPFNQITNDTKPADHTRKDVVSMNADTPYTTFGLDLRAEPIVISVPEISDRYYSFQFIDLHTHNFAYVGTRTTGTGAGKYLVVGPGWKGDIPPNEFSEVIHSESELITVIGRTQLLGVADLKNVIDIQTGYQIQPLSEYLDMEPKKSPPLDWIPLDPKQLYNHNFIKYFNFYLSLVQPIHEEDKPALKKFEAIGVAPGKSFDSSSFSTEELAAIDTGVAMAINDIKEKSSAIGENVNGWNMMDPFGNRAFYNGNRLLRAAAVMVGIYGNDKKEAFYPVAYTDIDGNTLNASASKYEIHFTKDNLPPAKYFWSITMYNKEADGVGGYLVQNPINRYLINSTTENLQYDEDGGLKVYIQHEEPSDEKKSNWLPAPDGEFYLMMRLYGPEERAMNGSWEPPGIIKGS